MIFEYNGIQLLLYQNQNNYNIYLNKIKDAFKNKIARRI